MSDDRNLSRATMSDVAPDAAGATRRRWFASSADAIVALAMVGAMVFVPLLGSQNAHLRAQLARQGDVDLTAQTLEVTLRRNIQLSALAGRALPAELAQRIRASLGPSAADQNGELLVMAYTPMVCERTLHEGLQSLNDLVGRRGATGSHAISLYALVGERAPRDRERALLLRGDGLLAFPLSFLPADSLIAELFPRADSTFDEEPLFLRLDRHFTIRSAFHADQRRPALLDTWLETIQ
jgi:hypothetical protein